MPVCKLTGAGFACALVSRAFASTTSGMISATKALRETGNLKLVSRMLNHRDLRSTLRYAHVLDSEVADAMERVAQQRRRPPRLKVV